MGFSLTARSWGLAPARRRALGAAARIVVQTARLRRHPAPKGQADLQRDKASRKGKQPDLFKKPHREFWPDCFALSLCRQTVAPEQEVTQRNKLSKT
jgi:hypothetical protein